MDKRENREEVEKRKDAEDEGSEDIAVEENMPRRHFLKTISFGTGAVCLSLSHFGCGDGGSDSDPDPDPDPDSCENIPNLENALKRIERLAGFAWAPVAEGIARRNYPETIPIGEERRGPPYSSVKTVGRTVGQDVSIETFLSAVRNPDSVLYTIDLNDIAPTGGAFYGAVCSNFVADALGWFYAPTTTMLSREWSIWGFSRLRLMRKTVSRNHCLLRPRNTEVSRPVFCGCLPRKKNIKELLPFYTTASANLMFGYAL